MGMPWAVVAGLPVQASSLIGPTTGLPWTVVAGLPVPASKTGSVQGLQLPVMDRNRAGRRRYILGLHLVMTVFIDKKGILN